MSQSQSSGAGLFKQVIAGLKYSHYRPQTNCQITSLGQVCGGGGGGGEEGGWQEKESPTDPEINTSVIKQPQTH